MQAVRQLIRKRKAYGPLGLDIGGSAVRVAQVCRQGQRWMVTTLAAWRRPPEMEVGDPAFIGRLAPWIRQLTFHGRGAVLGLSVPDLELHAMELPPVSKEMTEPQRQSIARFEVERLMQFESQEAETDYWAVPGAKNSGSSAIGVAAEKQKVDALLELCRSAKLDCLQIDATPCALSRFGWVFRGDKQDDIWAVLDIGERMTRLIVCVEDSPVLARSFDYGGRAWTHKLAQTLGISEENARRHKCDHGIVRLGRGTKPAAKGNVVVAEMIYNVLRSDLNAILSEVERSYRYVMHRFSARVPGPLILVGGGAAMQNLKSLIAEKLGIEVVTPSFSEPNQWIGFEKVAGHVREPASSFAAAIGLSLIKGQNHG